MDNIDNKDKDPARKQRNWDYKKEDWECPLCNKELKYGSRLYHLEHMHNGIRHLCKFCNSGFKRKATLKSHLDEAHLYENTRRYNCMYCAWNCKRPESLDRHLKYRHPISKKHFHQKCFICGEIVLTNVELRDHYKEHTEKAGGMFQCPLCDKAYQLPNTLRQHMLIHHPNEGLPFKCDMCDFYTSTYPRLKRHFRLTHGDQKRIFNKQKLPKFEKCSHITAVENDPTLKKPIDCDHCGIVCTYCTGAFSTQFEFKTHRHRLCCGICRMRYPNVRAFSNHIAYHEPEKVIPFRCEICKFGFPTSRQMNVHLTKVHKETDYVSIDCPWCEEKFSTTKRRNHHIRRVHTLERPYKCQQCNFTGVRKKDIVRHSCTVQASISMETTKPDPDEEVTFKCDMCDHYDKSHARLKKHAIKFHEDQKRMLEKIRYEICSSTTEVENLPIYITSNNNDLVCTTLKDPHGIYVDCPWCEEKFSTSKRRNHHLRKVHTMERPYKCQNCKFTCLKKQEIVRHNCTGSAANRCSPYA